MCAQIIPMMLGSPSIRKSSVNVGKYLLIFGGLGVAIIAFIFLMKKLNPFKAVTNFLGEASKNVLGFLGSGFKGWAKLFSGELFKKKKLSAEENLRLYEAGLSREAKTYKGKAIKDVAGKEISEYTRYVAKKGATDAQVRKEFRRYAKAVVRALNLLKKTEGIPLEMIKRIAMVKSAFKKVDRVFTKDIAGQFENVFNRKRLYLEGNLVAGFDQDALIKQAARYVKQYKTGGYASKLLLSKKLEYGVF